MTYQYTKLQQETTRKTPDKEGTSCEPRAIGGREILANKIGRVSPLGYIEQTQSLLRENTKWSGGRSNW